MKKRFLILAVTVFSLTIKGQTTEAENKLRTAVNDTLLGWKKGGLVTLNFSQASFSNWAAGGQNSISLNGLISTFINYKDSVSNWENMLDMGYGILKQGKQGNFIKTDDKIDLSSKYGRNASKTWYYAALLNFKTQMTPGYDYPNDSVKISDFLAPAYILGALGMDYKPNSSLTCFIAPITLKTTIVNNTGLADAGAFGVEPAVYDSSHVLIKHGQGIRNEFGGYVRVIYKTTFFADKSVSLLTKFDLFSNYLHNPQNIDVSWETIIGFKVNKFIAATITTHLLYDDDVGILIDKNKDGITDAIGPRTQVKEVLGIGFSYKF
ncbi:MAG: DUF3078 domain-containing protein [Bacteroidia bacterium]|jgi:hypothetical protein